MDEGRILVPSSSRVSTSDRGLVLVQAPPPGAPTLGICTFYETFQHWCDVSGHILVPFPAVEVVDSVPIAPEKYESREGVHGDAEPRQLGHELHCIEANEPRAAEGALDVRARQRRFDRVARLAVRDDEPQKKPLASAHRQGALAIHLLIERHDLRADIDEHDVAHAMLPDRPRRAFGRSV